MRIGVLSAIVALLVISPAAAGTVPAGRSDPGATALPSGGDALYSQLDDPSGWFYPDQAFETYFLHYDSEGADDFVVESPTGWAIDTVFTPGLETTISQNPVHPILFVATGFYSDGGHIPFLPIEDCQFPANPFFADDEGDLTIEVDCSLPPGRFWVSQQVRMDAGYVDFSRHWWATRQSAENSPAAWRNPGGEFAYQCLDWRPASLVCNMTGEDFLFELRGEELPANPVPAVGPLGLVGLVLSVSAGGLYLLRRRR